MYCGRGAQVSRAMGRKQGCLSMGYRLQNVTMKPLPELVEGNGFIVTKTL